MSNPDLNSKRLPPVPTSNELDEPSLPESSAVENQGGPSTVPQSTDVISSLGEFRFYKPTENTFSKPNPDAVPEEFFELTSSDIKSAQAQLVARVKAYQDAPLLTEKLRNEREKEVRERYPTTTIRIKFADRSVLEKTFPSSSKIKPIYAFVRGCLREDAKAHKFVLFESPPRRDLKVSDTAVKDKTLYDLHLAPQSILHFRFLEDTIKLDLPSGPPPLLPDMIGNAEELPPPPSTTEDCPPKTDKAKASANAKANADTKPAGRSSGKSGPVDESKGEKLSRLLKLGNKLGKK